MLDILFSGPVICCLLVAASAAFGVSVVLRYLPDRRRVERSLVRAEKALTKLQQRIAKKEAAIAQLRAEVDMLKPLHARLNDYCEVLTQMRLEAERQDLEATEAEAGDGDDDDLFARRRPTRI